VQDLLADVTHNATAGVDGPCDAPSISADGRFVVFRGGVARFTNDTSQIYVHDCWSNSTTLVSINCHGTGPCNMGCLNPEISSNGRYVFFQSYATDLAPGEFWQIIPSREAGLNVFRRDLQARTTDLVTQNCDLSGGGAWSSGLATPRGELNLTSDGNLAVVVSLSDDLTYGDNNGFIDLFVWRAGNRREGPRLAISQEGAEVVVRWPSAATNFVVQSTPDLSGSPWTNLPAAGTNTTFRLQPSGSAFFRLKAPDL